MQPAWEIGTTAIFTVLLASQMAPEHHANLGTLRGVCGEKAI